MVTYKSSVRITELSVISIFHQLRWLQKHVLIRFFLKLTANTPTNGWLEYDPFLLGFGLFSGDMLVSGSVFQVYSWMIQFDSKNLVANYGILWSMLVICRYFVGINRYFQGFFDGDLGSFGADQEQEATWVLNHK